MTDTQSSLQHKMASAGDLQTVVRTMKAMAAGNISQYEQAVKALAEYDRAVTLALAACLRENAKQTAAPTAARSTSQAVMHAIVFGSDQGLVGQFNDAIVSYTLAQLALLSHQTNKTLTFWVVGERAQLRLAELNATVKDLFPVPTSVKAIAPLISQLQLTMGINNDDDVIVFHHQPTAGTGYTPTHRRLLPLDKSWQQNLTHQTWPTKITPQILSLGVQDSFPEHAAQRQLKTLQKLIHESLFISLYQACAQSQSAENASRLAAMERADKNINELQESLKKDFNHLRQSVIDAELFDVITGYEALGGEA